jgi:probable addiction module antidote protein
MPRRNYHDELIKSLKNHDEAVAYLNAAIEEAESGEEDAQQALLIALRNIVEANGGFAAVAEKAELGRESLYKTLSLKGNPQLRTLTALFHALGIGMRFC